MKMWLRASTLILISVVFTLSGCSTSLLKVAEEGNLPKVRSLLKKGINTNEVDMWGMTPLMIAAKKGYIDIVKELVTHGADVNLRGWEYELSLTVRYTPGMVNWFMTYGVPGNITQSIGRSAVDGLTTSDSVISLSAKPTGPSAMSYAARSGHLAIVKYLLENGATTSDGHALAEAASQGHVEIVKMLLDSGVDVNAQQDLSFSSPESPTISGLIDFFGGIPFSIGYRALSGAISCGNAQMTKLLIERGADLNYTWYYLLIPPQPAATGVLPKIKVYTPISETKRLGKIEIYTLLKEAGAQE